jgi:hypothetical protein
MRRLPLVAALIVVSISTLAFAQDKQTFQGTITDSMCGRHHMMKNASDAQCTRECAKEGSEFALMSGNKMYVLKGTRTQIDKWAGQTVSVEGRLSGDNITVEAIKPLAK